MYRLTEKYLMPFGATIFTLNMKTSIKEKHSITKKNTERKKEKKKIYKYRN